MLRRRLSPANRLALAIERRQFAPGRPLVAVSHAVRRWLVEAYPGLSEADIPVVYNLPDLTRYRPPTPAERVAARERHGLAAGETALVLAGTNFALKGLGPTIEALALLPGTCRLLVAGGRNPGRFGRLARRLGVADRVTFLGRVDDMPGLYHAADVFVLPSFYDTCANAVLEARPAACRRSAPRTTAPAAACLRTGWWPIRPTNTPGRGHPPGHGRRPRACPLPGPRTWPSGSPRWWRWPRRCWPRVLASRMRLCHSHGGTVWARMQRYVTS
jgi:UDP-glucose:(heptosyl)LPS alpha-1,3-glucosyltransferase